MKLAVFSLLSTLCQAQHPHRLRHLQVDPGHSGSPCPSNFVEFTGAKGSEPVSGFNVEVAVDAVEWTYAVEDTKVSTKRGFNGVRQ